MHIIHIPVILSYGIRFLRWDKWSNLQGGPNDLLLTNLFLTDRGSKIFKNLDLNKKLLKRILKTFQGNTGFIWNINSFYKICTKFYIDQIVYDIITYLFTQPCKSRLIWLIFIPLISLSSKKPISHWIVIFFY